MSDKQATGNLRELIENAGPGILRIPAGVYVLDEPLLLGPKGTVVVGATDIAANDQTENGDTRNEQ